MTDLIRKIINQIQDLINVIRQLIGKEPLIPVPKPDPKPAPIPPTPTPPPVVADSPFFFGKQKTLVLVSYFDGLRALDLEKDLDWLKSKGVDGIRLYLNFSYPPNRPWDFLFQPDGSLHPNRLGTLGSILQQTKKRGMVVDISSSRRLDGVDGRSDGWQMPPKVYAHCWHLLAKQIMEWKLDKHIVIDLENESNNPWAGQAHTMTITEAIYARKVVQRWLPNVPITASVASHISPEAAVKLAVQEGMTFLGYHDPRVAGWAEATESLALRCRRAIGDNSIKVCFQEPPGTGRAGPVKSTNEFRVALAGAKRAQIAAWYHHLDAGFTLIDGSFESKLRPADREFLNGLGEG